MKISIGENLRRLRQKKGVTQEQFAEVMGVSPQAVSRWENDSACPDITMMPGIAMYYETSIDDIVGMDSLRRTETLNAIHGKALRMVADGQISEAAQVIREGLRLYPGNSGLLMALSETLAHREDDPEALQEAIRSEERALRSDDVSMKARSTATVNLLFLYLRAGRDEQARALVKSLPHIWESREIIMPEVYEGQVYREELRKSVLKTLVFLCEKIDRADERKLGQTPGYVQLGVDFTPKRSVCDMLRRVSEFMEEDVGQ